MKTNLFYLCVLVLQINFTPIYAQARLVFAGDAFMVIKNNAVLVVDNPSTNAITTIAGNIISENENNIIKWNIGTNTGTFRIPFTTAINATTPTNTKIPFALRLNGAGVGAGNIIFSTYGGLGWDNATYPPSDVTNMNHIGVPNSQFVIDRFWRIDANSYTQKPTPDIRFGYADNEWSVANNTIMESDLVAQYFDIGTNDWSTTFGVSNTATNTMSGVNITPSQFFKSWTLSSQLSPLPVELLYFSVKEKNQQAFLSWETSAELNTQYFEVERSTNAKDFTEIGVVSAKGSNSNYNFIDKELYNLGATQGVGTIYYRLRMVDRDFSAKYSRIESLKINMSNVQIGVYPNPFSEELFVKILLPKKESISLKMTDYLGRVLYQYATTTENIDMKLSKEFVSFAAGVYFLEVTTESRTQTFKLVRQ